VALERFPTIVAMLAEAGIDPAIEPVPVAPAAHYLIGGIRTDLVGATAVSGLFAVGECAYTGLHGANRLASNSLSECFVFGTRAAHAAAELLGRDLSGSPPPAPEWRFQPPTVSTRERLWRLAGPQRTASELTEMLGDPYPPARMIAASALVRAESRGVHRRSDFPNRDTALDGAHTVIGRSGEARLETWG
jgi:L-aspartate oxidase